MSSITPTAISEGVRRSKFASTRLLHEWASMQQWDAGPWYELRLGPTPQVTGGGYVAPNFARMLSVFNRYADLVGIARGEVIVVEAKMQFDPGAISQVQHYVNLVLQTELVKQYAARVVSPVILVAIDDPIVHQQATAAGIRVELFTPPWVNDWLARRYLPK
jgi:hypothetical protein